MKIKFWSDDEVVRDLVIKVNTLYYILESIVSSEEIKNKIRVDKLNEIEHILGERHDL